MRAGEARGLAQPDYRVAMHEQRIAPIEPRLDSPGQRWLRTNSKKPVASGWTAARTTRRPTLERTGQAGHDKNCSMPKVADGVAMASDQKKISCSVWQSDSRSERGQLARGSPRPQRASLNIGNVCSTCLARPASPRQTGQVLFVDRTKPRVGLVPALHRHRHAEHR